MAYYTAIIEKLGLSQKILQKIFTFNLRIVPTSCCLDCDSANDFERSFTVSLSVIFVA